MLSPQEIDNYLEGIQIHEGLQSYSVHKLPLWDRKKKRGHFATVPRQIREVKRVKDTLAKILGV